MAGENGLDTLLFVVEVGETSRLAPVVALGAEQATVQRRGQDHGSVAGDGSWHQFLFRLLSEQVVLQEGDDGNEVVTLA